MTDRSTKTGAKAVYAQPKLAVYGQFSKLTASGSGMMIENATMMGMMRRP